MFGVASWWMYSSEEEVENGIEQQTDWASLNCHIPRHVYLSITAGPTSASSADSD